MRLQLLLMQLLLCVLPGMEMGAYRLGRGGFFRKSGNYMYRRYDGYCISGRAVPLV